MTTTRIVEKLSDLVSSQLPEHIRADYTTFVSFLEAYYKFIEQDQEAQELLQNIRSYNDVDTTITSFIDYFIKQYCNDIPRNIIGNKQLLIKHVNDLYENKGNEKSYKLLFNLLYGKTVDFYYPFKDVLRASDGKWNQRVSFFMRPLAGAAQDLTGKRVKLISNDIAQYRIVIDSVKPAKSSTGISSTIFEYFIGGDKSIPINVGDIVEYENFRGVVISTPVTATIINGGVGFSIGDILPVVSGLGAGTNLKVTKVNSQGAILNVQFISYGTGYVGDFYSYFSSSSSTPATSTFSYGAGVATLNDTLSGFVERGVITTQDYGTSDYFAEDYSGSVLREFFTSTSTVENTGGTSQGSDTDAIIYVQVGGKTKYPGYYENTDGFLSDAIYLQDQDYYQPFSYVLKIDEQLADYKKAVLDLLHPAGMKLFGEFALNVDIDLSTELASTIQYKTSNIQDEFALETSTVLDFEKSLQSFAESIDELTKDISTAINNSISTVSLTDAGTITKSDYTVSDYFGEDYVAYETNTF
jgi:hypothetical protein